VAVGENQTIGSEDESRAATAPFARLAGTSAGGGLMDFDVDDRWADEINSAGDGARVGVE